MDLCVDCIRMNSADDVLLTKGQESNREIPRESHFKHQRIPWEE